MYMTWTNATHETDPKQTSEIILKKKWVMNENSEGRVFMSWKSSIVCVHSNLYHQQKTAGPALMRGITCTSSLQIVHAEETPSSLSIQQYTCISITPLSPSNPEKTQVSSTVPLFQFFNISRHYPSLLLTKKEPNLWC